MKLFYSHDVHTPSWIKIGIGDLLKGEIGWNDFDEIKLEPRSYSRPYRKRNGIIETKFHYGWDESGNPFDYPVWVYK
jgi:hypothetical protein